MMFMSFHKTHIYLYIFIVSLSFQALVDEKLNITTFKIKLRIGTEILLTTFVMLHIYM